MVLDLPEAYWIPPWIAISGVVSLGFLNSKKSEVSDSCAQQLFMDLVNTRYDDCLQIFTDGSKLSDSRVGAAMYVPDFALSASWRLGSDHSVLVAELYAVLQGLLWLVRERVRRCAVIFTYSMSALALLLSQNQKSHRRICTKIFEAVNDLVVSGSGVFFQWVPSHRNIPGNEHADTLARNACFGSIIENVDLEFEDNLRRLNGKLKLDRWS